MAMATAGAVIIRVFGAYGHRTSGPFWLEHFDVEANGGLGECRLTDEREKALRFANIGLAMQAWRTQSKTMPERPDGKPNRPLTAFTVEIEPA